MVTKAGVAQALRPAIAALKRCATAVSVFGVAAGVAAGQQPSLLDAAKNAGADAIRGLLQKHVDVNTASADGTTALHWASYRDDLQSADLLIRAGARVNAATDLGVTPLWNASLNGSEAMVRRLLVAGADPNATLLAGETPVMVAARSGYPAVVEQLIANGGDVNARGARGQTALMWAVAQRHPDVVKVLLAHRADIRARSDVWSEVMAVPPHGHLEYNKAIPHGGETALMFAARVGDLESAKLLVGAGADVNDADAWGVSALVLAAHSGFGDLVEFLLDKGADANASAAGFTALHEAIMRRDEKTVMTLLAHGADPNLPLRTWTPTRRSSTDFNFPPQLIGASPYWLAARFTQPSVMRALVKSGANPRFVQHADFYPDGPPEHRVETITPLMAATGMGGGRGWMAPDRSQREALMLETVKLVMEVDVDVNVAAADGRTALDAAQALKYQSVIDFLVSKGAKPGPKKKPAPPVNP